MVPYDTLKDDPALLLRYHSETDGRCGVGGRKGSLCDAKNEHSR